MNKVIGLLNNRVLIAIVVLCFILAFARRFMGRMS